MYEVTLLNVTGNLQFGSDPVRYFLTFLSFKYDLKEGETLLPVTVLKSIFNPFNILQN